MPLEGDVARRREARGHEMLGDMVGFTKAQAAENPEGEWNVYEITADGSSIAVLVNGKKVNEAKGALVLPGRIGLQSEGGESTSGASSSRRSPGSRAEARTGLLEVAVHVEDHVDGARRLADPDRESPRLHPGRRPRCSRGLTRCVIEGGGERLRPAGREEPQVA